MISAYRDLKVWRKAMKLAASVYRATSHFPSHEMYGLAQQMRRAATSIPCNIAEGKGRGSRRELRHLFLVARGSVLELETQLLLAHDLRYLEDASALLGDVSEITRMINGVLRYVDRKIAADGTH